ncbi:hypothetical protein J4558_20650 [Leptolyngbya sp. 15MV]|nr:hypothetical protein J4558_20650 [Leptolyngbya sp. 15MV]
MLNLAEYRRKPQTLADFLPWAALVAPGVILNKDGSFQRSARFRGPDLDSATPAELAATAARLNGALRRLGSGWAIFAEAQRVPARGYPASTFPDPVSALVDAERRAQFEEAGAHFESSYVLTFAWLTPADDAARAEGFLYEGAPGAQVATGREALRNFIDRTDRVLDQIEAFVPEARWLDDSETLTFLHSTVSTRRHLVRVPETPMHLDALLADQPLVGGLAPRLGEAHLRVLTIIGFPSATFPGILDELNALAFEYRWCTRAICLDRTDAQKLLTRIRRQWFAKRKSIAAILKEVMTNEQSVLLDSDAANKAADADAALQELGQDIAGWAYVTATVTVWDEDARAADDKLRLPDREPHEPMVVLSALGRSAATTARDQAQARQHRERAGRRDERAIDLERVDDRRVGPGRTAVGREAIQAERRHARRGNARAGSGPVETGGGTARDIDPVGRAAQQRDRPTGRRGVVRGRRSDARRHHEVGHDGRARVARAIVGADLHEDRLARFIVAQAHDDVIKEVSRPGRHRERERLDAKIVQRRRRYAVVGRRQVADHHRRRG